MMKKIVFIGIVLIILVFIGCSKSDDHYTKLSVYLYDSPINFDSLSIQIYSIELSSDSLNFKKKIKLKSQQFINILNYTNEKDTLLSTFFYDAANINRVTITFGSKCFLFKKGNKQEVLLTRDSIITCSLHSPIQLNEKNANSIWIDFDCYRSLIKGNSGKWLFNPAFSLRSNKNTGSVRGKIISSTYQPYLWLISADDTLGTLPSPINGTFFIRNVPSGIYSLLASMEDGNTEIIMDSVMVEAGKVTGVGTIAVY
jgi:hypothetical protein